MVHIPGGPFLRGSPPGVGLPDEHPQRMVELSAFEMDRMPVTFDDYSSFTSAGGYQRAELWSAAGWEFRTLLGLERPRFLGEPEWSHITGPDQPVCGVSFWEAEAFARYQEKRLPTEAEWEKAARGTDGRLYPWGNFWEEGRCSFRGGPTRAAPRVGQFPGGASPFGVLDAAGGVWEWCADWYQPDAYATAADLDPKGPASGSLKAARGGAWNALPLQNRTANRNAFKPTARFSNLGFRCAR